LVYSSERKLPEFSFQFTRYKASNDGTRLWRLCMFTCI
jgi:hypothetical protein